jgi:hypothetical protein
MRFYKSYCERKWVLFISVSLSLSWPLSLSLSLSVSLSLTHSFSSSPISCAISFSSENLFFWLDVENYSNIPGSDFRKRIAIQMCKKYIDDNVSGASDFWEPVRLTTVQSKMQVNISSTTRIDLLANLVDPSRFVFLKVRFHEWDYFLIRCQAQQEIYRLMETDTLPKYLDSPEVCNDIVVTLTHLHLIPSASVYTNDKMCWKIERRDLDPTTRLYPTVRVSLVI